MPRFSLVRSMSAVAVAAAACGLLAGCGGDDSTATGNPTPTTQAVPTSAETSAPEASGAQPSSAPVTSPGAAATAPPEEPQPVPSGFPGPTEAPKPVARDEAMLAELKKGGITTSQESATVMANYVCQSQQENGDPATVKATVVAYVGGDPATETTLTPEDAAQVFIDAAKTSYCK